MRRLHLSSIALVSVLCACQPEASAPVAAQATPAASATPPDEAASALVATVSAPAVAAVTPAKAKDVSPAISNPPAAKANKPAVTTVPLPSDATPATTVEKATPAVTVASLDKQPEAKTPSVLAEADALLLAKKSGCLTCHSIEKKIVGPAWKDVAAKYRGMADAQGKLETKVAKGGSGAWGNMAMPANSPRVAAADINALVSFILSLK